MSTICCSCCWTFETSSPFPHRSPFLSLITWCLHYSTHSYTVSLLQISVHLHICCGTTTFFILKHGHCVTFLLQYLQCFHVEFSDHSCPHGKAERVKREKSRQLKTVLGSTAITCKNQNYGLHSGKLQSSNAWPASERISVQPAYVGKSPPVEGDFLTWCFNSFHF